MASEFISERGLSVMHGGSGEPLVVLLHGLGASRAVWARMIGIAEEHWPGRWMAPDLRGHGRSAYKSPFGYGVHAADVADLIAEEPGDNVTLVGHSFGGVIAALTGSGWFGPRPRDVAAFGVKIVWTTEETAKAQELATRPARTFATREDAIDRFLKLSGLFGLVDPASETAASGVSGGDNEWRVAMDPRVYGAVGPSVSDLLRLSSTLRLAAGAKDPMVSLGQMRAIDPAARAITGAGHNAHWEAPAQVWDFINNKD
jgi:pimeloyl-ACP methyl ester carboxylesterase